MRTNRPEFFRKRLHVVLTVQSATLPHLADAVAFFVQEKVSQIHLSPLLTPDPSWNGDGLLSLEQQFERILALCQQHLDATGKYPVRSLHRWDWGFSLPEPGSELCGIAQGCRPVLDVDGKLYACSLFAPSGGHSHWPGQDAVVRALALGRPGSETCSQRREELAQRVHSMPAFTGRWDKRSSSGWCRECAARFECEICPFSLLTQPEGVDPNRVPDFLCAFNRTLYRFRRRLPAEPLPDRVQHHPALLSARLKALRQRSRRGRG
jgi:sulfatase maturation enzyme AslB (radical SAM superfamily)